MKQFLVVFCGLAGAGLAFAQEQPQVPVRIGGATTLSVTDGSTNLPVEIIGPDDLIGVTVYDSPELTRTVRVSPEGYIRLPMVHERIQAAGFYPAGLENAIADALVKEQILVDPIVTVSVAEYRSRPVSVVGAVKAPITFQATGNITLLDAIARAGGLGDDAGAEILVSRGQSLPDNTRATLVQRISVRALITATDPALNISLHGGEEIRVPQAGRIFVVGNVKMPGTYPLTDGAESSVLKALALSQGLQPYSSNTAYIYRTEGGNGGKNEIPINLKRIIDRKEPDVPVLANDIMYIPTNTGRQATLAALEKGLLIGTGLGAALIYTLH
jgi:polysaccharide export outer membrane protein